MLTGTVNARRLCLLSLITLLASGCGPMVQQPMPAQTQLDQLVDELQVPAGKGEVPAAVSDALLGGTGPAATAGPERFDIAAADIPAEKFFVSLMDGTDINVVTAQNLTGNITLNLRNVTLEEVLGVVREIYGYDYKFTNGIYTIYPRELHTEIFHINYLNVQRVGLSDTSVSVGQLTSSNNGNNRNNNSNNNGQNDSGLLGLLGDQYDSGSSGRNQRSGTSTQGARIQTLSRTDLWSSLQTTIEALIGGTVDGRQVVVTPQAGMVIVKALPNELHNVRDFLERSELSVQRQVQLEAKIIEVSLSDDYNAGINWKEITGNLSYNYANSRTETTTGTFASALNVDINKFLDLLATQGSVQVLSSPRVSTVNNQKAVIRVGSDEYFVTGISSDTTTSASAVVNTPNIEISPFFSGIALDVTPQISADGSVILHVHPVITDVRDLTKPIELGNQTFSFPTALRDIRESDSIVRAQSGQIVVLGGLMQEVERFEKRRHPGLGSVPLLGGLFRGKTSKVQKTELVILLKPSIIDANGTEKQLERSRSRIEQLGNEQRRILNIK